MSYTLPVAKFSLGRRVVFKQKDDQPRWGTVEAFNWEESRQEYSYVIARADGGVVRLLESQLTSFDRLN